MRVLFRENTFNPGLLKNIYIIYIYWIFSGFPWKFLWRLFLRLLNAAVWARASRGLLCPQDSVILLPHSSFYFISARFSPCVWAAINAVGEAGVGKWEGEQTREMPGLCEPNMTHQHLEHLELQETRTGRGTKWSHVSSIELQVRDQQGVKLC